MGTLYIDRKGVALSAAAGRLCIREPGAEARTLPLQLVERIVVHGQAQLDTSLLAALAEQGSGLVCLSGRHARRFAQLAAPAHSDARRRLGQYRLVCDAEASLQLARTWVSGKLAAQQRVLERARQVRTDQRLVLSRALERLQALSAGIAQAGDLDALRGGEGAAAAAYFTGLQCLFAAALGFNGRNRRPPRDPVNACLSLAYTLLHSEAVRAAQMAGLDPLLGCLHAPAWGRESLACDLIEPLRPHADAWVHGLFRERLLRAEAFNQDKGACLLGKQGRGVFFAEWECWAPLPRRWLRRQTHALARLCAAHAPQLASATDDEA